MEASGRSGSSRKSVLRQVTLAFLSNFSNIAPGMSLGFSAVAIPALAHFDDGQKSWFAGIASLATPLGCVLAGPVADRFGRKRAIFCVNLSGFVGWLIIGCAFYVSGGEYAMLLIGRVFTGLSTGLCGCPAAVYMAEVATLELRSVFTTWVSLFYAIGIFVVYLLGFLLKDNWGLIALVAAVLPIIGTIFLIFLIPESPPWLVSKNRHDEAKESMCKLHGTKVCTDDVHGEIETLISARPVKKPGRDKTLSQQFVKKIKMLSRESFLKPFALVLAYFAFQQFSGVFVVMFYAIDIVEGAKIEVDPYAAIVAVAAVRLVAMFLVSYFSRHFGKRALSIVSGTGMTISMSALGLYILCFQEPRLNVLPLVLLNLYFFMSTLGFYPLPFALSAEIYPRNIRGTASGISIACNYVFNFITVKLYPNMMGGIGACGVFFFYGGVSLVGTLFVWRFLPETNGKTLEEIQEYFLGKKKTQEEA